MSGQIRFSRLVVHLLIAVCTAVTLLALLSLLRVGSPAQAGSVPAAALPSIERASAPDSDSARPAPRLQTAGSAQNAPDAAELTPLPAKLELSVDPAQAWPGEPVTITIHIHAEASLAKAALSAVLPGGLELAQDPPAGAEYNASTRTLLWPLPSIPAGETALSLELRMGADARDLTVLAAELRASGFAGAAAGQVMVKRLFPPSEVIITPEEGGELRSTDGRVQVTFPAGALPRRYGCSTGRCR